MSNGTSKEFLGNALIELSSGVAADIEAATEAGGEYGLKIAEGAHENLMAANKAIEGHLVSLASCADALRTRVQADAVSRVVALINSGAISLTDITSKVAPQDHPGAIASPVAATAVGGAIVPTQKLTAPYKNSVKYYDPASGAGWSGRGPVPVWLKNLCVDGKTPAHFLVDGGGASAANRSQPVELPVESTSSPAAEEKALPVANDAADLGSFDAGSASKLDEAFFAELDQTLGSVATDDDDLGSMNLDTSFNIDDVVQPAVAEDFGQP